MYTSSAAQKPGTLGGRPRGAVHWHWEAQTRTLAKRLELGKYSGVLSLADTPDSTTGDVTEGEEADRERQLSPTAP